MLLKNKFSKKFLSAILALSVLFTIGSVTAFADDTDTDTDTKAETSYALVDESSSYYQEALEVLQISEEEARECNIYTVDGKSIMQGSTDDGIAPCGVAIPTTGNFYYFPEFSFYDNNNGSYWTCQGNRLKWGVSWNGTYDNNYDLRLGVYLYRYGDQNATDGLWMYNDGNGYTSGWLNASRCDYRFIYYSSYLSVSGQTPWVTVRMYVATKNV